MPRKTKEQTEKEEKKVTRKSTVKSTKEKSTTKATAVKSKASTAKKKSSSKATTTKKQPVTTVKPVKATTRKRSTVKLRPQALPVVEYYDLPYRYNQTVVKLLAQTPKNLFVYWDISDTDRENYIKTYGENFFNETRPVLIIHNTTLNYSFEVEINDFANSWYVHVNDSKCDYTIELGRRPIPSVSHISTDYIYVSSSNNIEAPNDRILFNVDEHKVYYRNVKTNVTTTKSISFIKNMGKIYNIYDLYKSIYKEEVIEELTSSSTFK